MYGPLLLAMSSIWYAVSMPVAVDTWILLLATGNLLRFRSLPAVATFYLDQYAALYLRWVAERKVAREYQRRLVEIGHRDR